MKIRVTSIPRYPGGEVVPVYWVWWEQAFGLVEGGYEIYDDEMIGWSLLAVLVVIGALLVDHLGLVGRESRPITLGRIIGAGLMLLGVALVLWFR